MRDPSPKTEHLEGKAFRMIHMFEELAAHLRAAYEESETKEWHVISRYRGRNGNLRTRLMWIIRERAAPEPWEKIFQNLRGTRQTDSF